MRERRRSGRWRTRLWRGALVGVALALIWGGVHSSAAAVRAWTPPTGRRAEAAGLGVRVYGHGRPVVFLLHGLLGSGDSFGGAFDQLGSSARIVVPDLLGFGRSMDDRLHSATLEQHLDALDRMSESLGLPAGTKAVVAGHSLGGLLALHWAARHPDRFQAVVTWGAPLYRARARGIRHVGGMGPLEAVLGLDTDAARQACAWACHRRSLAGALAVVMSPHRPVRLSFQALQHTWPAYRDTMESVVLSCGWGDAMQRLTGAGVPVLLASGGEDTVIDHGVHRSVETNLPNVRRAVLPHAGHDLILGEARWAVAQVQSALDAARPTARR